MIMYSFYDSAHFSEYPNSGGIFPGRQVAVTLWYTVVITQYLNAQLEQYKICGKNKAI